MAPRALTGLTVLAHPPRVSPHPAHDPGPHISPLDPSAPAPVTPPRGQSPAPHDHGPSRLGPPVGTRPRLPSVCPHPQGGAQCPGQGLALVGASWRGPGCPISNRIVTLFSCLQPAVPTMVSAQQPTKSGSL